MLFVICLIILGTAASVEGRVKRCFVCRSRGELGDCKDPFLYNSTTVEGMKSLEAAPCASGWCVKIVEGEDATHAATERMCLQRPPEDNEQRCAKTLYGHKKVFMCFCQGDLCNDSSSLLPSILFTILSLTIFYII